MCLAIPAQISELLDDRHEVAMVDVLGVRRRVNINLLADDPPSVGDWVLIHVGFAMSKISGEQAEEQLRLLAMLGEASAAEEEAAGYQFDGDENELHI
jgi:hydrogenase expression/formation protein HypC